MGRQRMVRDGVEVNIHKISFMILKKLIKYYKTSAICSYRRSEFSSQHPYLGISKLLITSVPGDLKLSFGP